jgi:hypothetical protein
MIQIVPAPAMMIIIIVSSFIVQNISTIIRYAHVYIFPILVTIVDWSVTHQPRKKGDDGKSNSCTTWKKTGQQQTTSSKGC